MLTNGIADHSTLRTRFTLLAGLQQGAGDRLWSEFFSQYRQYIISSAVRQGLGEDQARDVLQLVMMVVLREACGFAYDVETRSFRNTAVTKNGEVHEFRRFRSWLKGVVQIKIWEVKKFARRAGSASAEDESERLEKLADGAPTPDEAAGHESELTFRRAMLDQALRNLRASYKGSERNLEMFESIARAGMTYPEAASVYGITENHARQVVHTLTHRLKDIMAALLEGQPV